MELRPRVNGWALCSGCGRRRAGYDRLPLRRFEIVPLWGMKVFWLYAPRRVDCPGCGVKVEHLPWVEGKRPLTTEVASGIRTPSKVMGWSPLSNRHQSATVEI